MDRNRELMVKYLFYLVMGAGMMLFQAGGVNPHSVMHPEKLIRVEKRMAISTGNPDITDDCHWKGLPLYGKIKFVESFPDVKIKFVESFPDIRVKFVTSFPDKCGEWQVVESFPDLKVQVVESFPDIKVKIVESFPGVKN